MSQVEDLVPVGDGYALPSSFEVAGIIKRGLSFSLRVDVEDGRAYGAELKIRPYGDEPGLGSSDLRLVPLRDILVGGVLANLHRIEFKGREPKVVEVTERSEDVLEVVRRVVGYSRDADRTDIEYGDYEAVQ